MTVEGYIHSLLTVEANIENLHKNILIVDVKRLATGRYRDC